MSTDRRDNQRKHDIKFLKTYILKGEQPRNLGIDIPNIISKALQLITNESLVGDLYDADTALEFMQLLDHLLSRLQVSLRAMKYHRPGPEFLKRQKPEAKSSKRQQKAPVADVPGGFKTFQEALTSAVITGVALMRLRKGAALPMYLQNVQAFGALINVPNSNSRTKRSSDNSEEPVDNSEEPSDGSEQPPDGSEPSQPISDSSDDYERDQDLEGAHRTGSNKQPWERYLRWLGIILSPFDAIWILLNYVDSPSFKQFNGISMRILVAPPVDDRLLSWQALINNQLYFPRQTEWSADEVEPSILNNTDILLVLDTTRKLFNSRFAAITRQKEVKDNDVEFVLQTLIGMEDCKIDTFSTLAKDIVSQFVDKTTDPPILKVKSQSDLDVDSATNDCSVVRYQLAQALKKFQPWSFLFSFLNNLDGDGDVKKGFTGTLHCEVCVSSLLDERTLDNPCFKAIADELNVRDIVLLLL